MASVYVETSIFGALVDDRTYLVSRYQRELSRAWWGRKSRFSLFCSLVVVAELRQGAYRGQGMAIRLAEHLPMLPVTDAVAGVAEVYRRHLAMPSRDIADSLHLAVATVHCLDFLVTWNCRHLANANKIGRIERLNARLGLLTPRIVTPPMLLQEL